MVFEILPVAVASVLFAVLPAVAGILPSAQDDATVRHADGLLRVRHVLHRHRLPELRPEPPHRPVDEPAIKGSPVRLLLLLMMVCALLSTILADIPVVAMMLPVAVLLLEKTAV